MALTAPFPLSPPTLLVQAGGRVAGHIQRDVVKMHRRSHPPPGISVGCPCRVGREQTDLLGERTELNHLLTQ